VGFAVDNFLKLILKHWKEVIPEMNKRRNIHGIIDVHKQ